jgi:glycerophosphoryl diester phosphodiesterase
MSHERVGLPWLTARPIAHRGLHDVAQGRPENTLSAFSAAINADYAIECDLHPSSDGVPIVFHDNDLERLTGAGGSVRDRDEAALRALKIHGTDERIPTLDDLLDLVAGRVPLVIELKHVPGRDAGFAAAVVRRLHGYEGRAALMSFDTELIAEIRTANPRLPRGLTAEGGWRTGLDHLASARRLDVDFISYSISHLPNPAMQIARTVLGIPLICWTVRTPAQRAKADHWTDQITFEGFTP